MIYTKICLFCDTYIPNKMITCRKHIDLWRAYKDTAWANELKIMQTRQNTISEREIGKETPQELEYKHIERGRRSKKEQILDLYKEGLTRNEIVRKLKIPRSTVIDAIWRYNKANKT